ncbi:FHA domain-containing protein [Dactylosporangium vinaceum]|uniref:FHA domain-containing protein n=1 Tax=Dactylosporangium vinaceum TaxID=53362 RepID=A0ABV5MK45_9ACTN|nr:FHA domain-containing protein [Dactylosporangium vinaceum]UAB92762.1 FHA domain-containing protein [Dactylosporangium vinaceum]
MTGPDVRYVAGDWLVFAAPARWLLVRPTVDVEQCWRRFEAGAGTDELLYLFGGADLALVLSGAVTDLAVQGTALAEVVDHSGDRRTVGPGRHRVDRPLATIRLYCPGTPPDSAGPWLPLHAGVAPASQIAMALAQLPAEVPAPVQVPAPVEVAIPVPVPAPAEDEAETRRFDAMFGATYQPVRHDEFAAANGAPVLGLADINWALAAPGPAPTPPGPALASPGPAPVAREQGGGLDEELRNTVLRGRPETAAGPTVSAVRCTAGHPNPDTATACRACPAVIAPQSPVVVARPVLGRLLLPDGDAIALDRGVILGRAPGVPDPADPDRPHHVKLRSPDGDISRKHVEIRLDGWRVLVVDLHSSNGTYVARPGERPHRITPGEPVELMPGGGVYLNEDVTIRFEAGQ